MQVALRAVAAVTAVVGFAPVTGLVAGAASADPGAVGRIVITRSTPTSLTLDWPDASKADRYLVERAGTATMSDRRTVATTRSSSITVTGLKRGSLSCFQVRATTHDRLGDRSTKVCQYTPAAEGSGKGVAYRVMTYNLCGLACGHWGARRAGAAKLVRAQDPDVVMLEEAPPESGMAKATGLSQVVAIKGKAMLVDTGRFGVARTGSIFLIHDHRSHKDKYAVWAELVDKRHHDKRVFFVGTHLPAGADTAAADKLRRTATQAMLAGVGKANSGHRPVVVAGDFNTNQGRTHNAPVELMEKAGYASSFFRAHAWVQGDFNSATQNQVAPIRGIPWGYHVDHVWADPRHSVVRRWVNACHLVDGNYPAPQISNHCPVFADLELD